MTYINPISGTALPGAQVQQALATEKTRQVRQKQEAKRNIAADADTFEHTVENAEAVAPTSDEPREKEQPSKQKKRSRRQEKPGESMEHIDLTG